MKHLISPEIEAYCEIYGLIESPELKKLRQETELLANGYIHITPLQGNLLTFLAKIIRANSYLEIGTFTGYSTLWLAQGLPVNGKITTLDHNNQYLYLAKKYWDLAKVSHKIEVIIQDALISLNELIANQATYDLILIDANKAKYIEYYEKALNLVSDSGLIVIDNVLMYGEVLNQNPQKKYIKVIQTLNQNLINDSRVDITLLPIGDGLTLIRKKV